MSLTITDLFCGAGGSGLGAAGYRVVAERKARAGWDTPSRRRLNPGRNDVP